MATDTRVTVVYTARCEASCVATEAIMELTPDSPSDTGSDGDHSAKCNELECPDATNWAVDNALWTLVE